jgi:hypothetical protein
MRHAGHPQGRGRIPVRLRQVRSLGVAPKGSHPIDPNGTIPSISKGIGTGIIDALFTTGTDVVNFNNLLSDQQAAIASGADLYDGLGGNDAVTLPNLAATGVTWNSTKTFFADDTDGQSYTITGGDGTYKIALGTGNDLVNIGTGALEITSAVDTTSAVNFIQASGTLKIDEPAEFAAYLTGLKVGDAIDVADPIISEWIDGKNLVLHDQAGYTLDYNVSGNTNGTGFLISPDGHGGSLLILQANQSQAINQQSQALGLRVLDLWQTFSEAGLKATPLILQGGSANSFLASAKAFGDALTKVGLGINLILATGNFVSELSQAQSPEQRYEAVENFQVAVDTSTLRSPKPSLSPARRGPQNL